MKVIFNFFLHLFCRIFNIVRVKTFIVFPDKSFIKVKLSYIPDYFYFKDKDVNYVVTKNVVEIINETLQYRWVNLEKIT